MKKLKQDEEQKPCVPFHGDSFRRRKQPSSLPGNGKPRLFWNNRFRWFHSLTFRNTGVNYFEDFLFFFGHALSNRLLNNWGVVMKEKNIKMNYNRSFQSYLLLLWPSNPKIKEARLVFQRHPVVWLPEPRPVTSKINNAKLWGNVLCG